MRQIYIDLTTDKVKVPSQSLGYVGEHNATKLLISVPHSLVNESDYLIIVFKCGPVLYRSKRITKKKIAVNAYLEGNCVHCLMGRHLTAEQTIGLQVEGYKMDKEGLPLLIGKTPFIPKLTLMASPEGHICPVYDDSYPEIQDVIEKAHEHSNMDTLFKLSETEDGNLVFNGNILSDSILSYSSYSYLPEHTKEGTLAYVKQSDELLDSTDIHPKTIYSSIRISPNPSENFLFGLPSVLQGEPDFMDSTLYSLEILLKNKGTNNFPLSLSAFYAKGVTELLMISGIQSDIIGNAYMPGEEYEDNGNLVYLYNYLDGFDASLLFECEETQILSRGWYVTNEKKNIVIHDSGSSTEYSYSFSSLDFENSILTAHYNNCEFLCFGEFINEEEAYSLLSNIFFVSKSKLQSKGLYLFEFDKWNLIENSKILVVENRTELPCTADNGTIAVVKNSAPIYRRNTDRNTIKDDSWENIYINPSIHKNFNFYDFEISATYGYWGFKDGSYQFWTVGGGGFELILNKSEDYMLLAISPTPRSYNRKYYIYSWKPQSIVFEQLEDNTNVSLDLVNGWNEVLIKNGGFQGVLPIDSPVSLPFLNAEDGSNDNVSYSFLFTRCSANNIEQLIYQNVIDIKPFFKIDNAAGLWGFYDGVWQKLENNLIYDYDLEVI